VGSGTVNKRALESLIKSGAFDYLGYTRNHLLKVYDRVADLASEKQRLLDDGQHSLFEDEEEDPLAAEPLAEELERDKLLAYEKEMLGIYVTDHPLMQVREAMKRHVESDIADLSELGDGAVKWIGGIITRRTQRLTRKSELMANLTLEDLTGRVEVTVFPALYQQHREMLQEDRIVCVKARLEVGERDGDTRIIVVEAEDIKVGMIVDAVSEVLRVSADAVEPSPTLATDISAAYLRGVVKQDNRLIILLDLTKVLSLQEMAGLGF
jgi:DNA polymerase-3 subunit alpha